MAAPRGGGSTRWAGSAVDLVLLSDTHELHHEVEVPAGDVLIVAGDWTMLSKHFSQIEDFAAWLGELPHPCKVVIPGNHEYFLEADPHRRSLLAEATLLIDEAITIAGLKIWGSPLTPLYAAAFGRSSPADRRRHWAKVPDDTNILVTHGPPYAILDRAPGQTEHIGDPELLERLKQLPDLKLHVFGHVHGAYGQVEQDGVLFVNACLMGQSGAIDQKPVVVRINRAHLGASDRRRPGDTRPIRRSIRTSIEPRSAHTPRDR